MTPKPQPRQHRSRLWRAIRARPLLLGAILFGSTVAALTHYGGQFQPATVTLIGWDAGALAYLLAA